MSTFLAVVEHGSLSAASRRLKTPLATVSRKISELDHTCGRSSSIGRAASLCSPMQAAQSRSVQAHSRGRDGGRARRRRRIRRADRRAGRQAPVVFGRVCLIPILVDFLKAYPDIDVSLVLNDRVLSSFRKRSMSGSASARCRTAAWLRSGLAPFTAWSAPAPRISRLAERLARPRIWPGTTASALPALCQCHRMFGHSSETRRTSRFRCMRGCCRSTEAACDAARAGIGIASVGSHLVRTALECGALKALLDEFQPAPLPVHLVYTANRFLPIKVRAFLDFAAPRLRQVLAE